MMAQFSTPTPNLSTTMHSVTDTQTDRQTDRQQYRANSHHTVCSSKTG